MKLPVLTKIGTLISRAKLKGESIMKSLVTKAVAALLVVGALSVAPAMAKGGKKHHRHHHHHHHMHKR
ncbi:MAG: hypothetical protein JO316_13275 [Abitibacteriaceae bacterium]|nr:hypothetical protein [Abditibacteriaceae bacterium]